VEGSRPGLSARTVLYSRQAAYAETDLDELLLLGRSRRDEEDRTGPVSVAVAVQVEPERATPAGQPGAEARAPRESRLVVVGAAEFASDALLQAVPNDRFLLNAVSWLTGEDEALGIEPRDLGELSLVLGPDQLRWLGLMLMLVIPAVVVFCGVLVWNARRRDAP
jgi:ABC-type uncharacterized transport system involved in gliding motility auxiliary subunit